MLGEGDAVDGEEFLGVDGLEDGQEVVLEVGDLLEVFEADEGEGRGGEAVFAGILGGAGLALRGAGPVDLAALARLAASCSWETGCWGYGMRLSFRLKR